MEKIVEIRAVIEKDGSMTTSLTTKGVTLFEALGMLRFEEKNIWLNMIKSGSKETIKTNKTTKK